jgi:hypothetical protein
MPRNVVMSYLLFGSALRNVRFFSLFEIALMNLKNKIKSIYFFLFELFRFITRLFLKCSFRIFFLKKKQNLYFLTQSQEALIFLLA